MRPRADLLLNLTVYLLVNLLLSICNKLVLEKVPTPWLLTSMHATCTTVGCYVCLKRGSFKLTKLTRRENTIVVAFSCLFTVNIAMSNVSLAEVSLAFHQVARSTGPIFTVLAHRFLFREQYCNSTYFSIIGMTMGIGMVTYGDYYCTTTGFCLTMLGMLLAIAKTIATNRLMTGNLKFHPLELLLRMSPLAAVQSLFAAYLTGEFLILQYVWLLFTRRIALLVLLNGMLAFAQNLVSFRTNKIVGALTLTVCANLKQALTVLIAVNLCETTISPLYASGVIVVFTAAVAYSWTMFGGRQTWKKGGLPIGENQ